MTQSPLDRRSYLIAGFVVTLATLSGLLYYKWGGALRTLDGVRAAGRWPGSAQGLTTGGVLAASLYYVRRIWLALVYGLLIGASVRAFISPRHILAVLNAGGAWRRQLAGAVVASPLMLCSCCITPIFTSAYDRGARIGSALALMFASPGLNPAALALTAILFPLPLTLSRFSAALVAVLLLPLVVERLFAGALAVRGAGTAASDENPVRTAREFFGRFAGSFASLAVTTLPLIAVGVGLSSLLVSVAVSISPRNAVLAVPLVATIAVLIALPTFFEIPLAMLLLNLGAPGAAAALLVAGPIVNLPSLLVLARETRPAFALAVAVGVWLLAVCAGLVVGLLPPS